MKNAGLAPWPKLFQNLRSSCETEWLDTGLPAHVIANWVGHSVKVQNDSYAQVDDHHFERFNEAAEKCGHFWATKSRADERSEEREEEVSDSETSVFVTRSKDIASVRISKIAEAGLEPARP